MLKALSCPYVLSRKCKGAGECEMFLCGTSCGLTRYFSRGSVSNASPNIDRQYSAILACCFGLRKDVNNIGVCPCRRFMSLQQRPVVKDRLWELSKICLCILCTRNSTTEAMLLDINFVIICTRDLKRLTSPRGSRRKGWQETARSWRRTLQWPQSPPKGHKQDKVRQLLIQNTAQSLL